MHDDDSLEVVCHFEQLTQVLCSYLKQYDGALVCSAWLTSVSIIDTLSTLGWVEVIISAQPLVLEGNSGFRPDLKRLLKDIIKTDDKQAAGGIYICSRGNLERRSAGPLNIAPTHLKEVSLERRPTYLSDIALDPRDGDSEQHLLEDRGMMHHKFVVFLQEGQPEAVWTGSANLTENSQHHWENAVYIKNKTIAQQYQKEFYKIKAVSRPL
jgi:phosphatidylserine/phosphatidylglycerophosphate/cardiolipin synthase-like enzyme